MPITANIVGTPLGSITGTIVNADDGIISGSIGYVAAGTISSTLGVPGPAGVISATSPLSLASGVLSIDLSAYYLASNPAGYQTASDVTTALADYRTKVDYDFTNVTDTAITTYGLTLLPHSGTTGVYDSYVNSDTYNIYYDFSQGGTIPGNEYKSFINASGVFQNYRNYISDGEGGVILDADIGFSLVPSGLSFRKWDGSLVSGTIQYASGFIIFGDGTVQVTAFIPSQWSPIARAIPSGGVVNQALFKQSSTNYDTTWRTVDIYSTTSTTSLTVAKTTQTLTVGTYLGYTPLQDVTIAATADPLNQHMHGQVVSYSQTTGVMVVDVQSKTGSGTYSAWTVNIGGIGTNVVPPDGATGKVLGKASATDYDLAWVTRLDPANNLSDLANAGTARTNLGLGSAATLASSAVAQTANNLSDLANAGTARTNLGLGTAATRADSYFLQTANNLSDVTASTARTNLGLTTVATSSFATEAQSVAQSSSTTVNAPASVPFAMSNGLSQRFDYINTTSVAGSGAVTTAFTGCREMYTNATGSGGRASFAAGSVGTVSVFSGLTSEAQTNFSKKIWLSGRFCANLSGYAGDANGFVSISLGGYITNTTGAMTVKGIGLRKYGGASSVIELVVHNGSSQSTVSTSKTMGTQEIVEYLIYSDGAGNVDLYLNGSLAASSSSGPTGATANYQNIYREQVEQTASATAKHTLHCYGGQVIFER